MQNWAYSLTYLLLIPAYLRNTIEAQAASNSSNSSVILKDAGGCKVERGSVNGGELGDARGGLDESDHSIDRGRSGAPFATAEAAVSRQKLLPSPLSNPNGLPEAGVDGPCEGREHRQSNDYPNPPGNGIKDLGSVPEGKRDRGNTVGFRTSRGKLEEDLTYQGTCCCQAYGHKRPQRHTCL